MKILNSTCKIPVILSAGVLSALLVTTTSAYSGLCTPENCGCRTTTINGGDCNTLNNWTLSCVEFCQLMGDIKQKAQQKAHMKQPKP